MLKKNVSSSMFPKLFEPGYIGTMQLKNRIVKAPTTTCTGSKDGWVTDRTLNHYRESAKGDTALIIVENSNIDDIAAKQSPSQISISSTADKGGLVLLVSTMKEYAAKTAIQLGHAGGQKSIPGFIKKAPSPIPITVPWEENPPPATPPDELTIEEIQQLIEAFGDAALRAKQIGFDMTEILGCHGYLVSEFLSSLTNKRKDKYGGSLNNRMRFLIELVENQRHKVGADYPLCVRLSGTDYVDGGVSIDDTIEIAKALEKAGVTVLHISGGIHISMHYESPSMYMPLATHVWAAEKIKKAVGIPIIASGSINTPELAEKILEEGKADFVSLCRPLLADPYFPLKARTGHPEDIAPCIRCGDGCITRGFKSGITSCTVNTTVYREEELQITSTDKPKRVAIVGGGPGGMEAARVAALKGHDVTLFEKSKLGGALIEASVPEFKADIRKLIDYLYTQIQKLGVKIIHIEVTAQLIRQGNFDVVIVATGATPWAPDVPGIKKPSVIQALDVLRGVKTGESVIVVGGGMIGRDVALYLAEQGKKVTITTRGDTILRDMNISERLGFQERLSKQNIDIRTGLQLVEVLDDGVIMHDKSAAEVKIMGDTVVLAAGMKPNRNLFDELSQVPNLEVYAIGDCDEPRAIYDAIHEGYLTVFEFV